MNLPDQYCLVSYLENVFWHTNRQGIPFLEGPAPGFAIEPTTWQVNASTRSPDAIHLALEDIGATLVPTQDGKPIYHFVPEKRQGLWEMQHKVKQATKLETGRLTQPFESIDEYISSWSRTTGLFPTSWDPQSLEKNEWERFVAYNQALRAFESNVVKRERILWSTMFARNKLEWNMQMEFAEKNNPALYNIEQERLEMITHSHFGDSHRYRARTALMQQPRS